MDVIGRGFLAQNLAQLTDRHPDVVVIAAGVSSVSVTDEHEFRREVELVYDVIQSCIRTKKKLVFFSSASAAMYSAPGSLGVEDGPVFPPSPYGRHKLALERVLEVSGVDYQILRLTHVIGSHQREHQLLPGLVAQIRTGKVQVHRGAHRDIIGADDFVTITDTLVQKWQRGRVVNVGSGYSASAEDIVGHIQRRLGVEAEWTLVDRPVDYRVCTARLRALVPQTERMGFGPRYFADVFDRYLDLYRTSSASPAGPATLTAISRRNGD
ncbi:NAD-dependent epimerase [Lentzea sp. NBRC 105346]|uniref:NAD-dependent epimerase/dehydratase family protein n=1 Tax=Lentzea sp. NBRC 105346 TaxID=3032205 RepID=UPI0024A03CBE|nr:NAD-dependent epimerase/dehydratase family protein [Lentzea sp. NBRC 105346]GLZ29848.1 NAD-dependent epimerase [Lentzea sp. NBRC 105346]